MVLSRALDEAGIFHDFAGAELQAEAAQAELVEQLVDRVRRATGDDDHDRELFADLVVVDDVPVVVGPVISSRGRRLGAYLLEAIPISVALIGVRALSEGASLVLGFLLVLLSSVVLVALAGGTLGMLVVGMRVVSGDDVGMGPVTPPGWRVAGIRWVVATWPSLLVDVAHWGFGVRTTGVLAGLTTIWFLACFGAILFDPLNRGLHDRAAGTLVIDHRRERRSGAPGSAPDPIVP